MTRIMKYMKGYSKLVALIVVLLVVQAFCDLSLPQYTSDIIDTGIQNKGVTHVLPEKVLVQEFENAQVLMTDKEKKDWKDSYRKDGKCYQRKELSQKRLEKLDDEFSVVLICNVQMASMPKEQVLSQMGEEMTEEKLQAMYQQFGLKYHVTVKKNGSKKQEYLDARPLYRALIENNVLTDKAVQTIRDKVKEKCDAMGDSLVQSTAVNYTIAAEKAAGVDVDQKQTDYLWVAGAKMLLVALVMAAALILVCLFAAQVGAGIGRDLRGKIYSKVMRFSDAEMNQFSTASLITRSTNDVQQVQQVTTLMLRMIIYAPILGIGGIIKVIQTGSGMGWIIVLAVVLLLVVVMFLLKLAMPKFKKMQTLVDRINLVSREILTGLSVIRAFGREKKEEERFEDANVALTKNMLFTNRVMTFMMPCMMLIMNGISILIVWVSADKIDQGTIQVGTMTAFLTYSMQIVMAFLMLTMLSVMAPRAAVASERIDEVLATDVLIQDAAGAAEKDFSVQTGTVTFHDVGFAYLGGNENVIEHVSFTAKPGQTTAIIGGTGSGKSTLINLIPRFYDVTEGKITVDGEDIRNISQHALRDAIGYVPQKGVLFSGTIASNLKYGREDATQEQMEEAIAIAQAKEIVDGKKEGYDSPIAQGGSNVSGGQKQRFSIARAIVKDPKIYIFDDSFSALDYKTDAALRKELAGKTKDATVFIVAQRISTILHAEQIIVLDEGRVAGIGTHEELMKNCSVYRDIAASQLTQYDLEQIAESGKGDESHE